MRVPRLTLHRGTGQGRVRLHGRDHYCGPFGTPEAESRYRQLIAQFLRGELTPPKSSRQPAPSADPLAHPRTVELLAARYVRDHARLHYRHADGSPTSEQTGLRHALVWLTRCPEGKLPPSQFGPKAMKSIRAAMVESGRLSRGTVNKHIGRIRRMFKWATSEELVPVDVFTALCTVQGLQRGRTMAKDHDPRRPVEWEDVEKTVEHLPPALKALVLVQWHCGARGGELLAMRPADINRGGDIWEYVPPRHKGSWRGHSRVILLGKDAQSVLAPLLATKGPDDHVFSPRDTRQRAGVGDTYDANAYSKWVRAAAKQAGANHWTPHMLRHAFASRVRSVAGIEQTRVLLGHASAVTSEIYARRDLDQARDVIRQVG